MAEDIPNRSKRRIEIRLICCLALLMATALFAARWVLSSYHRKASSDVCHLVEQNYYRSAEPRVKTWLQRCIRSAANETFLFSKTDHIARINARLSALDVSHLTLYSPSENRMLWQNESLDTGIRSRMIDGHLLIARILRGSPAAIAGLRPGDELLTVDDHALNSSYDAQIASGRIAMRRGNTPLVVELRPADIIEDLHATLTKLNSDTALLRIPSFLTQYFDEGEWQHLMSEARRFKTLVIDVRGNPGGSFPAMLRAVSPFRCDAPLIGTIYHGTESGLSGQADLHDDLNTKSQLEQLHSVRLLNLRAYANYGCYRGPVTVLIDSETSSVAEIFAEAFFARGESHVWGQPSAGQVVMAQWFPVPSLGGDDYSLSIPIAGYRTAEGVELENQGLAPEKTLFYDLRLARQGQDSWLAAAMRKQ